jgi:hypothetical protein
MKRVLELVELVRMKYPEDRFFDDFDHRLTSLPLMAKYYGAYENVFCALDDQSWRILTRKAIDHFLDHRVGQLKQGFFNQLNDAFAYKYLTSIGCSDVTLLMEDGKACPDISYVDRVGKAYCEVKTISISSDEITRRSSSKVFDSGHLYGALGPTCLKKLNEAMDKAVTQMSKRGAIGLTYVLMHFDDLALDHFAVYRQQIRDCLVSHPAPQVVLQVGVLSDYKITKP